MTIAKDFAAKLSVAIVAVAMVLVSFASTASAQTAEELQAMINDLLAQIAQLEAATGASAGTGSCVSIMAPLTIGSTGADVTALQNRLISEGYSIPAGATGYFGTQTQSALAAWQADHGVSPAVGYYGPITKAAMDAACTPADDMDDEDMDDMDDDSSDVTLSGEASLDVFEIDDAEDDEIEEGVNDAPIAEVTIEFADGDARISRMDITLDGGPAGVDPWDVFDELSIWVDGDKVADVDAGDEDEYLDEDTGELRLSGLDIIAMEDEELEIIIAVDVRGSVDTADLGDWDVSVDALRFFDADGVATTETSFDEMGNDVTFTVVEAGADDELIVKTSSNDPDATTLQVEDDKDSDWYTVFVFDLDTDDSENDIEINSIPVTITVSSSTFNAIVDDAELVIDGTTIDDYTVTGGNTATAVLTFDVDGDVVIDAGDRVEAELMLRFNSLNSGDEGTTVQAEVTSANADAIDAEGADDLDTTQLSGAAQGEAHTLRTEGIDTEMTDSSATVTVVDGDDNDYATFEIEVEVTAFEQDAYIPTDGSTIDAVFVDNSGATSSVTGLILDSTADEVNGRFEITEGDSETLTITATFNQTATGSAQSIRRLRLNSIGFYDASAGGTLKTQATLPATDYRTALVTIVN